MNKFSIILIVGLLFLFNQYTLQGREEDKVDKATLYQKILKFPIAHDDDFDMYAGYVDVGDETDKKEMYYWFMEQQRSTKLFFSKKTILWMNGGPGCSSLSGALSEVGPFFFNPLQKQGEFTAQQNPYSWNKLGNLLFLEFPFGVGFSSQPTKVMNDYSTAQYNYKALIQLYKQYPELKETELYIVGESYAGIYVPALALEIHRQNLRIIENQTDEIQINLAGFAAGNPCTDDSFECALNSLSNWPMVAMLYEMGLISENIFTEWKDLCLINGDISTQKFTYECKILEDKIYQDSGMAYQNGKDTESVNAKGPFVNWYDAFRECQPRNPLKRGQNLNNLEENISNVGEAQFLKKLHDERQKQFSLHMPQEQKDKQLNNTNAIPSDTHSNIPFGACVEFSGGMNFLNNKEVRNLLKVHTTDTTKWLDCSDTIMFKVTNGSYWIYQQLTKATNIKNKKYKIMVYSGNTDLCVPITGTRIWIEKLRKQNKLKMITPSKKWEWTQYFGRGINERSYTQVGGFFENYDKILFVEFQSVGHMVPEWAPEASLCAFANYLNNDDLDNIHSFDCHSRIFPPTPNTQEETK